MPQVLKQITVAGETTAAAYTVPAGKTALVASVITSAASGIANTATLRLLPSGQTVKGTLANNVTIPASGAVNLLAGRVSMNAGDSLFIESGTSAGQYLLEPNVIGDLPWVTTAGTVQFCGNGAGGRIVAAGIVSGLIRLATSDDNGVTWVDRGSFGINANGSTVSRAFFEGGMYWFVMNTTGCGALLCSRNGTNLFIVGPELINILAIGGGRFLAIGGSNSNASTFTTNGYEWTPSTLSNTAGTLFGNGAVRCWAYSAGVIYAGTTSGGSLARSVDEGVTWTPVSVAGMTNAALVYVANGNFFFLNNGAAASYWWINPASGQITSTAITNTTWVGVAYNGTQYVFVDASGSVSYTATYGGAVTVGTALANTASGIVFGAGLFVVWNNTANVYTTPNGTTSWTTRAISGAGTITQVVWTGTQFVASSSNNSIVTSPDGINWTRRTMPTELASINWGKVEAQGSTIVAVASGGQAVVAYSSDGGATWSHTGNIVSSATTTTVRLATDGTNAVVSTTGSSSFYRFDLATFKYTACTGLQNNTSFLAYFNAKWYQLCASGSSQLCAQSTDGITFTTFASPFVGNLVSYCIAGSAMYATTDSQNGVMRCTDPASTWTVVTRFATASGTVMNLGTNLLAFDSNSQNGRSSSDGITWVGGLGRAVNSGRLAISSTKFLQYSGGFRLGGLPSTSPNYANSTSISVMEVS